MIHDEARIHGFFGDYRWLGNFGDAKVRLDGVEYASVERAYQAAKWRPENRGFFVTCTNRQAIAYNREQRPDAYTARDWGEAKNDIMYDLLMQKFNPATNPENATHLIATVDRHLQETNWWNDTYWGVDIHNGGQNTLGELLMTIRTRLHSS